MRSSRPGSGRRRTPDVTHGGGRRRRAAGPGGQDPPLQADAPERLARAVAESRPRRPVRGRLLLGKAPRGGEEWEDSSPRAARPAVRAGRPAPRRSPSLHASAPPRLAAGELDQGGIAGRDGLEHFIPLREREPDRVAARGGHGLGAAGARRRASAPARGPRPGLPAAGVSGRALRRPLDRSPRLRGDARGRRPAPGLQRDRRGDRRSRLGRGRPEARAQAGAGAGRGGGGRGREHWSRAGAVQAGVALRSCSSRGARSSEGRV